MVDPWGDDYEETKLLLAGRRALAPLFSSLVDLIEQEFAVRPVNARLVRDAGGPGQHRLDVILMRDNDRDRLTGGERFGAQQQRAWVKAAFKAEAGRYPGMRPGGDDIFVVFSSFESVARWEAANRLTDADRETIRLAVDDPALWRVMSGPGAVAFLFQTEDQLNASKASGGQERCLTALARFMERYDDYGFLSQRPMDVLWESKDRFEAHYRGSSYLLFK